jgi:hypothetical protein
LREHKYHMEEPALVAHDRDNRLEGRLQGVAGTLQGTHSEDTQHVMVDSHQVEDRRREVDIGRVGQHILVLADMYLLEQGNQGIPMERGSHRDNLRVTPCRHQCLCLFHLPCLPHLNGGKLSICNTSLREYAILFK